ncbi:MAG TPA: tetratricopeptide repeat protein [Xanthobacteraceae bacterium]|jgi:Tfp pilus assembly protein PilF|nr:tetratricopeptide repeat protein [Xanthobacteraceae bacterium]
MSAPSPRAAKEQAELNEALHHHEARQWAEAEKSCRRILRARPSHSQANLLLGRILKAQGKDDDAIVALKRAIAVDPKSIDAYIVLGLLLQRHGKLADAEKALGGALALNPDHAEAQRGLGGILFDQGRFADSVPLFRGYVAQIYSQPGGSGQWQGSAHKSRHDREQRDYLSATNPDIANSAAFFHLDSGGRVDGHAVNPDKTSGKIEVAWQKNAPQIAVIDDLLTNEALEKLREFCWRSTVWQRSYSSGYLGTVPELGFACPLLAQITEELRATYPAILGDHTLTRCWAFKYDSRLKGINIHADFAAVNVNFWITPDDANLEPESGGLVIWDQPAPIDQPFEAINNPGAAAEKFLQESGAKTVTVPHRANRAVIFDSDLYHKTDHIVFKEGYLNRRINITLLFGRREGAPAHDHDHDH